LTQNPSVALTESVTDPAPDGASSGADRFLDLIADELVATEELLTELCESDVPFVRDAGEYIFSGGGKRVRPALLLLCSKLLERNDRAQVTYAAVVEVIHNATLIHDDIIDHASVRRGRSTVAGLWGNSRTVLLGDWLYTKSMQMALTENNLEVVRRLCDATVWMTEGELLALERLGAIDLTIDEYLDIIDRKTSRLFAAACSIPALIPPAVEDGDRALYAYGRDLGICFQLVDDLLDFTASQDDLGKPVLSDLTGGKLTLPLILALPRLAADKRRWIEWALEDRAFERVSAEQILELVKREGTLEEVRQMAERYATQAVEALAVFPHSPAREALDVAPDFVLNRSS